MSLGVVLTSWLDDGCAITCMSDFLRWRECRRREREEGEGEGEYDCNCDGGDEKECECNRERWDGRTEDGVAKTYSPTKFLFLILIRTGSALSGRSRRYWLTSVKTRIIVLDFLFGVLSLSLVGLASGESSKYSR